MKKWSLCNVVVYNGEVASIKKFILPIDAGGISPATRKKVISCERPYGRVILIDAIEPISEYAIIACKDCGEDELEMAFNRFDFMYSHEMDLMIEDIKFEVVAD